MKKQLFNFRQKEIPLYTKLETYCWHHWEAICKSKHNSRREIRKNFKEKNLRI